MPHTDAVSMSLRAVACASPATLCAPTLARRRPGESRFARPVATITWLVVAWQKRIAQALSWRAAAAAPRIRKDIEVRAIEERYSKAVDHGDIERLERAFDRREAEGMRTWDWR